MLYSVKLHMQNFTWQGLYIRTWWLLVVTVSKTITLKLLIIFISYEQFPTFYSCNCMLELLLNEILPSVTLFRAGITICNYTQTSPNCILKFGSKIINSEWDNFNLLRYYLTWGRSNLPLRNLFLPFPP